MEQEILPIRFQEHLQLQTLGINAASIGFNTLTMESDRFICIREKVGDQNQVAIIDMNEPDSLMRRPISADSAVMHPDKKIIALKAARQLQIFDIDQKTKLRSHMMGDDVVFWKWIGPSAIGLVTETGVFHWSMETAEAPQKMFDRHASLADCQIINYRVDSSGRWMLLVGISAQHGRVAGSLQLFNSDRNVSQPIEGHAGTFAEFHIDGAPHDTKVFAFAARTPAAAKLHLVEIDRRDENPVYPKRAVDLFFPPEAANDFPVAMQVSPRFDLVYLVTKYGFIHIYDLETGTCLFVNRISSDTIFVTAEHRSSGGLIGVNRRGQVLSVCIDEQTIVPYLLRSLNSPDIAIRFAAKNNLPGADDLFVTRFAQLLQEAKFADAAKVAARSPRGILRTRQTIDTLKSVPAGPGEISPLLHYFGVLLETGTLNKYESLELARPVLAQGKKPLLEKWLKENKLECSDELGDIVRGSDLTLALSVYLRADVPEKVCQCFAELGQFSKIVLFARKVGFQPNYFALLQSAINADPAKGVEFAKLVVEDPETDVDVDRIFELFAAQGYVQQATAFVLEKLKQDSPELGPLQTKLLLLNLRQSPQVADAILAAKVFHHYDKALIAQTCESAGLYQRAIEHYENPVDITRAIASAPDLAPEWILSFFSQLPAETILACLDGLLAADAERYARLCTQVAIKCSGKLEPYPVLDLLGKYHRFDALFAYLGSVVNTSTDPHIQLAYIKAATRTGHVKEVERVCRESNTYDPEAVKNFLKESDLADQLPLIIVCDRFGLVPDLVLHLYQRDLFKYIEVYVQRVNPSRTPDVVAALMDVGCDERVIQKLILAVPSKYSVEDLVKNLEQRNRLAIVLPLLEQKTKQENTRDPAVFNALAKIHVDSNSNAAETFLAENTLYDPLLVGKYCEKRNPQLALIAYERGKCDKELIALTNENAMFKQQGRYLVKRKDPLLWKSILDVKNPYRPDLLEQLIHHSIVESREAEEVSVAVKAFLGASLLQELVCLLEKLLTESQVFASNKNLQNLLVITAVKIKPDRVMDYVSKFKGYDAAEVSKAAVQAGLFEEALVACQNNGLNALAMDVLVTNIKDFGRAQMLAETCNEKEVWAKLGMGLRAQGMVKEAIDAYIKADNYSDYMAVIEAATVAQRYHDLVRFLQLARAKSRDQLVESELLYALAVINRLDEIEAIISKPNFAQISHVADRCFGSKLYQAAKLLYGSFSNFSKLAITLVHLRDFNGAIECAKKANNVKVWADLSHSCLEEKEYRLAQVCGLYLVQSADELENLIYDYESQGLFDQLIQVLEAALSLERVHMGIFTELAAVYSRHKPDLLMEHLTLYWSKMHIPRVISACEEAHQWAELVFLYLHHDDNDKAVCTMIDHDHTWDHDRMSKVLLKVVNPDTIFKVIRFYHDNYPLMLTELLMLVGNKVDPVRVVEMFRKSGELPLIKSYLVAIQPLHFTAVNNALNELLLEEEDHEGLYASFLRSDKFDVLNLASRLEVHRLREFRRLAAILYKISKKWPEAIEILKREMLFRDAIEIAAEAGNREISESLLQFFGKTKNVCMFMGCLYSCYEHLSADVVLELAWRNKWTDFSMPFFCQTLRQLQAQ